MGRVLVRCPQRQPLLQAERALVPHPLLMGQVLQP